VQVSTDLSARARSARIALDAWTREVVAWHFDPSTGCPFWLDFARKRHWDPRRDVNGFADLSKFGLFEDEWLRGGPVRRWVPKGLADKPVFVFETGGTTGIPKTAARRALSQGLELADARTVGPAAAAAVGRAPGAVPRRHLLLR
jgi:hypothetical protein